MRVMLVLEVGGVGYCLCFSMMVSWVFLVVLVLALDHGSERKIQLDTEYDTNYNVVDFLSVNDRKEDVAESCSVILHRAELARFLRRDEN